MMTSIFVSRVGRPSRSKSKDKGEKAANKSEIELTQPQSVATLSRSDSGVSSNALSQNSSIPSQTESQNSKESENSVSQPISMPEKDLNEIAPLAPVQVAEAASEKQPSGMDVDESEPADSTEQQQSKSKAKKKKKKAKDMTQLATTVSKSFWSDQFSKSSFFPRPPLFYNNFRARNIALVKNGHCLLQTTMLEFSGRPSSQRI